MKHSIRLLLIYPTIAVAACSSDPEPAPMTPTPPTPRDVQAIPGGGTAGGAVAGVLTVFVQTPEGAALEGATVVVESTKPLSAKTDTKGRVDFWDEGLKGARPIHVFADAYAYQSMLGIDASVVTINLSAKTEPADPTPAIITATGTITGWSRLAANTSTSARIATVTAIGPPGIEDERQPARPGTVTPANPGGSPSNLAINGTGAFPNWTDYRLRLDNRATHLVAVGGIFALGTPPTTDLTHVGIRKIATSTVNLSRQDIELTHALDQSVQATLTGAPDLAEKRLIFVVEIEGGLLPLGAESLAGMTTTASATGPLLSDAFAPGKYAVYAVLNSAAAGSAAPEQTVTARRSGTATSYTFSSLLTPAGAPTVAGRAISAAPSNGATLHSMVLRTATDDLWHIVIAGDDTTTVTLPAAPMGVAERLSGQVDVRIDSFDFDGANLNEVRFETLPERLKSQATRRAKLSF